jgi:hypothetical protein
MIRKDSATSVQKDQKVYCVHTGMLDEDSDGQNWASYTLLAHDVEEAIKLANDKFEFLEGEYATEVEIITTLD